MFNEIAEGIYSVDTRFVDGTNGLIFTSSGAVALDVGFYPDTGEAMADFIRARGHTPDRVVLTHGHSDHVLGGAAFRGADVFGNMGTADQARNQLAAFARRFDKDYDELMTQALLPNITFSGDLLLDMGDRTLRLFPTPGHSPDHISLYIAPERILFAGDTVVTGIVPAIGDGDSRVLEATLRGLLALDMDVLVAGRYAVGNRRGISRRPRPHARFSG
jgi:cyclase